MSIYLKWHECPSSYHVYFFRSTIRDKIIPHAVSWFTGEAVQEDEFEGIEDDDDEDDDEDEIDDEDDEEDEEDDEDDDEDEEDEPKAKSKKKVKFSFLIFLEFSYNNIQYGFYANILMNYSLFSFM